MSYTYVNSYVPVLSFSSSSIYIDYLRIEPSFYSIYDVAALQSIYGVNTQTNTDDNIYTASFLDYSLQTIWDAGGIDTIDLSTTVGESNIDLRAGTLNSADVYSLEDIISIHQNIAIENGKREHIDWVADNIEDLYTSNNLYTGKDNFAIATGVVIENLYTGSGDDIVTDNEVDNIINTAGGDDSIYIGEGGRDTVDAGAGFDTLYLDINYIELLNVINEEETYTLLADTFEVSFVNVEKVVFTNGVEYTPDLLI